MGYFRRKPDRGRSRRLLRRLEMEAAADPEGGPAWEVVPATPPRTPCYLRFSCAELHPCSGRRAGIFTEAYGLLGDDELDPVARAAIRDVLDWFSEHLPAPASLYEDAAIFLFKSTAGECTSKIWELVHLLRDQNVFCEMQRFVNPGRVVFEDDYQVAVVPHRSSSGL